MSIHSLLHVCGWSWQEWQNYIMYVLQNQHHFRKWCIIKSAFIWLTEQYSTALSSLGVHFEWDEVWNLKLVMVQSIQTENNCEHTKKETKCCFYYPFPTGPAPGIFVFSVTTKSPHPHHEKMPNSINFVWLLCKILMQPWAAEARQSPSGGCMVVVTVGIGQCTSAVDWCM